MTYYNNLSEVDPGSLLKANNTIADRDGILQSRRGFGYYGPEISATATDRARQLLVYKNTIISHVNSILAFDDGTGVFTNFSGSYNEVDSNHRIKSLETKGNLYLTTSTGIKKISAKTTADFSSAAGVITDAGAPNAIGGKAVCNFSISGFLNKNFQTAYKVSWAYKDLNGLFVEGAPSTLIAVQNEVQNAASVDLTFYIPYVITSPDVIFRIYRTEVRAITDAFTDDYRLIFEGNPTAAELSSKAITYNDFIAEEFRNAGEQLYTNTTAEGGFQANNAPPVSLDIELFNNYAFYANTRLPHILNTTMTSTTGFVSGTTKFIVSDGTVTNTYTLRGQEENSLINCQAPAFFDDHDFFFVNSANNARRYYVWMDKTGDSVVPYTAQKNGRIALRANVSAATTVQNVADAIALVLNTTGDFAAVSLLGNVSITNVKYGDADATSDSSDSPTLFTFSTSQQGLGEDLANKLVYLSNDADKFTQIEEITKSLINCINANTSEIVTASYSSGSTSVPGLISFQKKTTEDTAFYLIVNNSALAANFSPALNYTNTNTVVSIANPTQITTTIAHGLTLNSKVLIFGATTTASINGIQTVTNIVSTTAYKIAKNVTVASVGGYTVNIKKGASASSAAVNGLSYSKLDQPESVPIVNQILVGSSDYPILRIKALRESLFIFKKDGLYRLNGSDSANFTVSLFDNTVILKAADSIAVVNNEIYYFGNQGVAKLSEVGKDVISKPIYDKLIPFITTANNLARVSFGIGYETDRSYLFFTILAKGDTYSTVCYRMNVDTQCWTEWKIAKSCGILKPDDDKLYFGSAIDNVYEQERKNFDRFDYADRAITLALPSSAINGTRIKPSSFSAVDVDDVITQTQYVTIFKFNQLLQKLDIDTGMNSFNFFSNLKMIQGASLASKVQALVNQLNISDTYAFTDSAGKTAYTYSGFTDFAALQVDFNNITIRLNESITPRLNNYYLSTGTTLHEAIVIEKNSISVDFGLEKVPAFMEGPIVVFKGIKTEIEFVPQHGGDPSMFKQFSQGTLMFEYRSFYAAKLGYSSDLSMNPETIQIKPNSYGNFGDFVFGQGAVFGGLGDRAPLRTYVPLKKQRARTLNVTFSHGIALQSYALYGLSLTYNSYSERAYK
ncbi:MAG: hypothetical protein ACOYOV_00020 [Bacteroidales bacterium]